MKHGNKHHDLYVEVIDLRKRIERIESHNEFLLARLEFTISSKPEFKKGDDVGIFTVISSHIKALSYIMPNTMLEYEYKCFNKVRSCVVYITETKLLKEKK